MGKTQGVAVACGEHISHLFFTNDSLIFYKASLEQWAKVKNILNIYARGLRKIINEDKSTIFKCMTKSI